MARHDGRGDTQPREVTIEPGWHKTSDGSALYRAGNTVVLCTASIDEGVRDFLRGQNKGWVTAEYLMHPRAGARRQNRDGFNGRPLGGRTQEIARLIGRSLRSAIDLEALGERSIYIDCDVLEADGGTRTAAITGAMVALCIALDKWRKRGLITKPTVRGRVAAISAGEAFGRMMLDLAYDEDSRAEMDLNVVGTDDGRIIEIQCTAEGAPMERKKVDALVELALGGLVHLGMVQRDALKRAGVDMLSLMSRGPKAAAEPAT
ncbi:MAG: ribonuclease PH [Deltaproteobacteria bacterium]|nr:ribonuclease PH [Deltaproteobacteria bacterium]